MKPRLDMNKIARGLRAERPGEVSTGGGYLRGDAAAGGHRDALLSAGWWSAGDRS